MRRIRIFGDSHVGPLRVGAGEAAEQLPVQAQALEFYTSHGLNWGVFDIHEEGGKLHLYSARAPQQRPLDYRLESRDDLHFFSSPLHSGPTYRNPAWKQYCPWSCATAHPERQAVSTATIEAWAQAQMRCRFEFIDLLKAVGYRVAVVEPPKPLARTPKKHGLPADVLTAVDEIYRRFITRCLAERGIPVIAVPEHTHRDGFTVDDYCSGNPADPHHGNPRFGAEMVAKIVRFAASWS